MADCKHCHGFGEIELLDFSGVRKIATCARCMGEGVEPEPHKSFWHRLLQLFGHHQDPGRHITL